MYNNSHFPRIEVYQQQDLGDPDAWNNTWTDPLGKTVYGGARDYRPHIVRRTLLLDDMQKNALLELPLTFLPYFREERPGITLGQYAGACRSKDREVFRKLFPANLDGLYSHRDNENFSYFDTHLLYDLGSQENITVIWLDADTWYVDQVYYRLNDTGELLKDGKWEEEVLVKGELNDFKRYSPVFRAKLNEGFPELTPAVSFPVLPSQGLVFSYLLSPGMPNTTSYSMELSADGTLRYRINGSQSVKHLDAGRMTALFLHTLLLDWQQYENEANSRPLSQDHDRQQVSMTVWTEGKQYRLHDPYLASDASPLAVFMQFVLALFEPELQLGKK